MPRSSGTSRARMPASIRNHAPRQLGLFDRLEANDAATALKQFNGRHGRFALRSAATLPLGPVYADRANGYDICDVRGKICF